MQLVCDSKGVITNVVAIYPGSVHDSFILRNSVLFQKMRDGEYGDGWLLGKLNSYIIFCFVKIIPHINDKYVIAVYILFLR